ncbi:transglutaminase family protein [Devosia rhodophyticola]|uniref:Transglutaminase family protein n=1 Tax=Devosia rhodophyticola TaxID=3026423 RepID=A0ABY7Z2N0_9HYPH|nr:transglutaminase family protein [Devosia rhodophyticola]WDR07543.1 transglutaminase family protein [Devosia rhodophyticola]
MLYDIRLQLNYEYDSPVQGGRHLIRVRPGSIPGVQRVIAASLTCDPPPTQSSAFTDFFGNGVTTIAYSGAHEYLDVKLTARVMVEQTMPPADLSPTLIELRTEMAEIWSVAPDSPHHFLAVSRRIPSDPEIATYARQIMAPASSVFAKAMTLCNAINADFAYDSEATDVETSPAEAFALKKGVCQDFSQVMISGLRSLGIPAGYVSGFLRTNPPPGKPRLEGADAMHAWVRVWCGRTAGWIEFDPTNAMLAGPDHITIGHGRDYADIAPIVGVLKTSGSQEASQSVDVLRLE